METNHFSSVGRRVTSDSNASISSRPNFTPLLYSVSTSTTSGCPPFQVIVSAYPSTASTESSNSPFQCNSRMPQHRSIGLYLLWYGGEDARAVLGRGSPGDLIIRFREWGGGGGVFRPV